MASNIDQIFQDFILNKIKEIHDRHNDKTATDGSGPASELTETEEASKDGKDDSLQSCSVKKKQKKSKKHKSKKKKKSRYMDENSSSSESDSESKHRKRRETLQENNLDEDKISEGNLTFQKRHTSAKKKKKKRKKELSSHSETEFVPEPSTCSTMSPRREELPDIIPRQHSITMTRGQEQKDSSQSSLLQSSSSRKKSCSRSRSRSRSRHRHRISRNESTAASKLVRTKLSSTQRSVRADEYTESSSNLQSPDCRREPSGGGERSSDKERHMRKEAKTSERRSERKSSERLRRSVSVSWRHRRRYRSNSRSPVRRRRSRSRSRRRRKSRSRSRSRSSSWERRKGSHSQREHRKVESNHSSAARRSSSRKHGSLSSSPQRISELVKESLLVSDKNQLLEIAKANAAAMCANAATMTAALCNTSALTSLLPLAAVGSVPAAAEVHPNIGLALEEVRRKISQKANNMSIKEFTDKCKMIANSKEELPVATPAVADDESSWKPFSVSAHQKPISFNINTSSIASINPTLRCDVGMAKEFPVSSGSQHRKKESTALDVYGEWVPVDKTTSKTTADTNFTSPSIPASSDTVASTGQCDAAQQPAVVAEADCVFNDQILQTVDISQAVNERIKAQRRLAENPYDVKAICMLNRAQEQVDAWAQSGVVPGFFTGSTGAQVLSSEDLSTSGPQAWLKKDQFLRATPVSGGVGEFLMRKMGWKTGEGLGRNRKGTVEPIIIDFKVDRKGLVATGEKPQKPTGGLVVTKDLMGKHPVSALIELCNKRRILQPEFVMVHHSGPDHRKNFLFKVTVNGVDYQPQAASPNKKHAKAMAATVALQALGEVAADGPGLYTGPVFTAASTGPLFST